MCDESFPADSEILEIKSPPKRVGGPYVVVFKEPEERWAIVAMDWDGEPCLGIRWFWGNNGYPPGQWFVIPSELSKNILFGLPLAHEFCGRLEEYLSGRLKKYSSGKLKEYLKRNI